MEPEAEAEAEAEAETGADAETEAEAEAEAVGEAGCSRPCSAAAYYDAHVRTTAAACAALEAAEQGSQLWHTGRKARITASRFAAAAGHNPYCSPDELLRDFLWGGFRGNEATRWGSRCEPLARDAYVAWAQRRMADRGTGAHGLVVRETGLLVDPRTPWVGVSPDGLVEWTRHNGTQGRALLEIKCPFYKREHTAHPYVKPDTCTDGVPVYYRDQVQGIMGFLAERGVPCDFADFVVWTPRAFWVTRVRFDAAYFRDTLRPRLEAFYFDRLLPALAWKAAGRLEPGMVVPALDV